MGFLLWRCRVTGFAQGSFAVCRWSRRRRYCSHAAPGLPVVHHDDYVCPLPANHRFPMAKFTAVHQFLLRDSVVGARQVATPTPVGRETAAVVHTAEYVDRFFSGATSAQEQRRTGFPWSEGLVRRCRLETGGTLLASSLAMTRGLACSTAGGTHHAFPGHGSGFCLLNDLAVAAGEALRSGRASRVLVVDLDVHQGDGTAYIFRDQPNVFTFSVHCGKNFPHRKQASDLDLSLAPRLHDRDYLAAIREQLPWILDTFRPDLVLYDAGVDPHESDDLGLLSLTDKGLYDRDFWVIDRVVAHGIACACVIGGGYSRDLEALSLRHTIVHRAAAKVWANRGL